jgi:TPR repeat protein
MKANRSVFTVLLLFSAAVFQLRAEQTEINRKQIEELRAKAETGDADSEYRLGLCYYSGEGVAKDFSEAVKWFRKSAEQGLAQAQGYLGSCYARGEGVTQDFAEVVKWSRKAADQGDGRGQNNLGLCYADGKGVGKDYAEAVKWYRKAAEQNFDVAQFNLGGCYFSGKGVAKDYTEAVKWCRKAAEQNYAMGQCALGACYTTGQGVAKDYAEAVKWYRKAAEQNYAMGQCALGDCYLNGQGVAKDYAEAVKWYRKAAEQNYAMGQNNLGVCYTTGKGVGKDYAEAAKWYRKAAEQNFALGQYNLGGCYLLGYGVAKDYVEGYKWSLLAAGQGNGNAKKNMTVAESRLTRERIAEGQRLARNFKPREVPSTENDISGTAIAQTRPESSGTGFFITEDGYLITNEHVAGNGAQVRLVTSAGLISAKVIKVDAANDLALLKAEGKFTALPVTTSRAVKLGTSVATVGFPDIILQGFAPKFARGEIGSLSGMQDDARYFQISVPVQPGNSGGALVDEHGNVVGVVTAKLSAKAALLASGQLPENVNYAVKSSFLLGFLESVPDVAAKLKEPNAHDTKFEDMVEQAKDAALLVLVY